MADLVWAADGEWKGKPVKAGDLIPEMDRADRVKLYNDKRAVRKQNGNEATEPPPTVETGAPEPTTETTEEKRGDLHRPDPP
jgi:hypothetical protein